MDTGGVGTHVHCRSDRQPEDLVELVRVDDPVRRHVQLEAAETRAALRGREAVAFVLGGGHQFEVVGHVGRHGDQAEDVPFVGEQRCVVDACQELAPVPPSHPQLPAPGTAAADLGLHEALAVTGARSYHERTAVQADDLVAGPATQPLRSRVQVGDPPIGVHRHHGLTDGCEKARLELE